MRVGLAILAVALALSVAGCGRASASIPPGLVPADATPSAAQPPSPPPPDLPRGLSRATTVRLLAHPEWISFNQQEIEDLWLEAGAFDAEERQRAQASAELAASYYLSHPVPSSSGVKFDEPLSIFSYVFESLPPLAIVYPTETYYYYRFPLRERTVAGNLRFVDADKGILHIGYFDRADQQQSHHLALGKEQGVVVEKTGAFRYRVRFREREVEFILGDRALRCSEKPRLLRHEVCVTGVLDESGIPLQLVFDTVHKTFTFVVNESIPPVDALIPLEDGKGRLLYSRRTEFIFYRDARESRQVLVAVSGRNVYENNYFDGPFDQVPPRLALREKLELAYPYLKSDPIDAHGNFVNRDGQRVAISPYLDYGSLREGVSELKLRASRGILPSQKWAALTYDGKRDFHKTLAQAMGKEPNHRVYLSQGWPANHLAQSSHAWPASHRQAESSLWPANADASGKAPEAPIP